MKSSTEVVAVEDIRVGDVICAWGARDRVVAVDFPESEGRGRWITHESGRRYFYGDTGSPRVYHVASPREV